MRIANVSLNVSVMQSVYMLRIIWWLENCLTVFVIRTNSDMEVTIFSFFNWSVSKISGEVEFTESLVNVCIMMYLTCSRIVGKTLSCKSATIV